MKLNKHLVLMLVVAIALGVAACGASKKMAATTAIKAAEDAYTAVKAELAQYVPDEAKGVEDAINSAKENLTNKNYDAALELVKALPDKIKELTTLAATKKDELTNGWAEISGGMPKLLETIKSRLDVLSASKRLPANLDKAKLEVAKGGYDAAAQMWNEAQTAFSGGNLADAMTKAKTVQEKAVEVMTSLGMQLPPAVNK
jgi:hypothetical protein